MSLFTMKNKSLKSKKSKSSTGLLSSLRSNVKAYLALCLAELLLQNVQFQSINL